MEYISKNNFSLTRLKMLMKREFTINRQQMMLQALVMAGMIIAVEAFVTYATYSDWKQSDLYYRNTITYDSSSKIVFVLWLIGLYLFSTISASFVCSPLATKPGKINTFMTVGTQLEKYLSRALVYTIGFVILYFTASAIIDAFRCMYILLTTPVHPVYLYKEVYINWDGQAFFISLSSFLLSQAYFTMISAYMPKLSFIKGFCIAIGIQMVIGIIYTMLMSVIIRINVSSDTIIYTYCSAAILFATAMHIIAYYRYKETDL